MISRFILLLALLGWLLPRVLLADVLVLIHGYQSGAHVWAETGIDRVLSKKRWRYGGRLFDSRGVVTLDGPGIPVRSEPSTARSYYTVSLPHESGLWTQVDFFSAYIQTLKAWHPDESFIFVGHSAGGLVARLYMVRNPAVHVRGLITVATPNMGSQAANVASFVGNTPLSMFAPMMGLSTLNRSQGLFDDLSANRPGSILYWLNRQRHPVANYVSIVRRSDSDAFVSTFSQDLRNVPSLGTRATSVFTNGGHSLSAEDGPLILRLLDDMRRQHNI